MWCFYWYRIVLYLTTYVCFLDLGVGIKIDPDQQIILFLPLNFPVPRPPKSILLQVSAWFSTHVLQNYSLVIGLCNCNRVTITNIQRTWLKKDRDERKDPRRHLILWYGKWKKHLFCVSHGAELRNKTTSELHLLLSYFRLFFCQSGTSN